MGKNGCVFSELSFQLLHNYIWTCHNISLWNHNLETSKNHQETWSPTPEHPDTSENCELAIHSSLGLLLDLDKAFWAHWSLPWTLDQMSQCKPTGGSQSITIFCSQCLRHTEQKQTHSTVPAATEQNPKSLDPCLVNENYPLKSVRSRILDCIIYLYIYKDIYMYIYKSK